MVYTVTFNPAIDYVVRLDKLNEGKTNRTRGEQIYCGGKGINVSAVLAELGVKSAALGFTAGFTGKAIGEMVKSMGINADFTELKEGCSRINVKIKSEEETEINAQGPKITDSDINRLCERLDGISDGDFLVLAGSIPPSLPDDIYEKILAGLRGKKIKAAVDATNKLLLNVLKYKPFLVKPNESELGEMFGTELKTKDEIIFYAKRLKEMGAVNVLVSMAEKGAVLIDERGEVHSCGACRGVVQNSVGAGDSMVAGFIAGLEKGDYGYALKLGTAAGGATAFSEGLAKRKDIFELMKQL